SATIGADITILSGLEFGTYTIYIKKDGLTDPNAGCEVISTFTIVNDQPTISITDITANVDKFDNENCDSPNGYIEILNVLEDGVQVGVANYEFTWENSNGDPVAPSSLNGPRIETLEGDTYTVSVLNTITGCTNGAPISITIEDVSENPLITLKAKSADNYCDNTGNVGNGGLAITIEHPFPTEITPVDEDEYYIEWYRGTFTSATSPGTGHASFLFDNASNTGTVANIGDATMETVVGDTISGLADGTYTVYVTKTGASATTPNLGCIGHATFTIINDETVITIPNVAANITVEDNENCTDPNGSIEILRVLEDGVDNPLYNLTDYTFTWTFNGGALPAGVVIAGGLSNGDLGANEITNLEQGTYNLTVANDITGCTNSTVIDIFVDDVHVDPIIQLVAKTADTYCDNGAGFDGDGTLEVAFFEDGSAVNLADYSIEWYRGNTALTTADNEFLADDESNAAGSELGTVVVTGGNILTLEGLMTGEYTVHIIKDNVTDPNRGCEATRTFTIELDQPVLEVREVSISTTPDTNCDTNNANGTVSVNAIHVDGVAVSGAELANYTINWLDLNGGENVTTVDVTNDRITNILPGTYTGQLERINTNQCISAIFSVTVDQEGISPTITGTAISNTFCSGGNGEVTLDVTAPDTDESHYQFDWYEGQGTSGAYRADLSGVGNFSATGLEPMFYTILVTAQSTASNGTGCMDQIIVEVKNNPDVLTIPASGVDLSTDVSNCSPDNGQIIIDGIRLNGADITDEATLATYTYELFDADDNSLGALPNPGSAALGDFPSTNADMSIGTYFVRVTNPTTGCVSNPRVVVIDDVFEKPELSIVVNSLNSTCDAATADGELEVTIAGPDNDSDYTVDWYYGVITSGTAELLTSGAAAADGFTPTIVTSGTAPTMTSTISGLLDGSYYAVVTDISDPNNQCSFNIAKTVLQDTTYQIDMSLTVTSEQTECNPNGTVEVTSVDETRHNTLTSTSGVGDVTPVLAVYDLQLLDADQNFIRNITSNAELTGLAEGNYFIQATHQGTSCTSVPFGFRIEEEIVYPVATAVVNVNTSCTTTGDGSIEMTVTTGGIDNGYTVDWKAGPLPTSPNFTGTTVDAGNVFTISGLSAGSYTAVVTDVASGCTANFTYEIVDNLEYPVINVPNDRVTANTSCATPGDGEITINASDITISGVAQTDLGDFSWRIYSENGSLVDGVSADITPTLTSSSATFSNLSPDVYVFEITTITTGCAATSFSIEIFDESVNPDLGLITVTPNANCDGGTIAQGAIEIEEINGAAPTADFSYRWFTGNTVNAANEISDETSSILADVTDGNYTVEVTNTITTCISTQTINVTNDPVIPLITSYEVNNNLFCNNPNGSFSLVQIGYDGLFLNVADSTDSATFVANYEIQVTDGSGNVVTDSDLSTAFDIDGLEEANNPYTVIVVRTSDSNCESDPLSFNITDNPLNPVLQIVQIEADSTCSPTASANGILRVIADNQNNNDSTYNFTWTNDAGVVVGTNNDSLINVAAGFYSVEVEHILSGCISNANFTLTNEPAEPRIIAFDTTHYHTCVPSDALFEVTAMSNGPLSDFTFTFYDEDPTEGTPTPIQDGTSPVLSESATPSYSVAPGEYWVQATQTATGCTSNIINVLIEDFSVRPNIALASFLEQTNCDPSNPSGSLTVTADGSQDTTVYQFEWADASGTVIETNNPTADSLASGDYTVTVTVIATGCTISQTFTMIDNYPDPLQISISSEGNSNCVDPNGQLAATVINIPAGKALSGYQFYWFDGDLTGGPVDPTDADFIGTSYTGLQAGEYTLYVVDGTDLFCTSEVLLATVRDLRDAPDFRVDIVNHMTICTPELPNGRAAIGYTENNISRYTFEWYLGTDTTSAVIGTGTTIDSLAVGVYSAVATDLITGCTNVAQFIIEDATELPPAPSVTILQHRTNCSVPDGRAIARVNGESEGYLFEWFEQNNPSSPVFTGSEVTELDSITYLIQATNIETGCVSPMQTITILNDIVDPIFDIRTSASLCLRSDNTSIQLFNGTAQIVFEEFHTIEDIEWHGPNGTVIQDEVKLVSAEPGLWTVYFTPDNGCEYTMDFEIDATLKVYNGVSANGDGKNDFFIIDCIEYFPDNKVTIYNRDGTLVYEAERYNNIDVRFEGASNVGRNGLKLPVGTYFYFIDKGDGSEKIQGYLELVR
ncbi:gliding motility-associated C-terminal domain-containing protein, partial [Marinoscillum pacificum]|uniref:gliding motility-associated C-terminal domain-containing protein n=1 Tax=Marinoscillum pacificum TaxID=392723 RepID=UPI0021572765